MKGRSARVEDLLRSELAQILQREIKDPRLGMVTVSYLRVAADLSHAEVGISALGTESERDASVATLERAQGFVRTQLARRTRLRRVPELSFKLDRGAEHSQRISTILETLYDDSERT